MQARIETLPATKLVGKRLRMSFAANRTPELWQSFMPLRNTIPNRVGTDFFSVEVYESLHFFKSFNPYAEYEKWAVVEVDNFETIPAPLETLVIPEGLYAVFNYKGLAKDAHLMYRYILNQWLPNSPYALHNRPHFARMGAKYKNNDPMSEEELWIPIITKYVFSTNK